MAQQQLDSQFIVQQRRYAQHQRRIIKRATSLSRHSRRSKIKKTFLKQIAPNLFANGNECDYRVQMIDAGSTLDRSTLNGSTLDGSTLDGSTLNGSTLEGSTVDGSTLEGSTLDGSTLERSTLEGSTLDGSTLEGSTLEGSTLDGSTLDGSTLDGSTLERSTLQGSTLERSTLDINKYMIQCSLSEDDASHLSEDTSIVQSTSNGIQALHDKPLDISDKQIIPKVRICFNY